MDVIDEKKLAIAILYLERMTEGRNPVNNMSADENEIICNANVKNCMLFVKQILEDLKEAGDHIGHENGLCGGEKQEYPLERLVSYQYEKDKSISRLVDQLNCLVDTNKYNKLVARDIIAWLKQNGYLEDNRKEDGTGNATTLTEKGAEIGIKAEKGNTAGGTEYIYLTYTRQAQKFVVENMRRILGRE